jgi:hypothetical protein
MSQMHLTILFRSPLKRKHIFTIKLQSFFIDDYIEYTNMLFFLSDKNIVVNKHQAKTMNHSPALRTQIW